MSDDYVSPIVGAQSWQPRQALVSVTRGIRLVRITVFELVLIDVRSSHVTLVATCLL